MEPDESREGEGPLFPWLPPEDRLWRHPSEVGSASAKPTFSHSPGASRLWTVAIVSGLIGAVLASGVGLGAGLFPRRTVIETVSTPTPNTVALSSSDTDQQVDVGDWPAIANDLAPSLVDVSSGGVTESGVLYAPNAATSSAYVITTTDAVGNGPLRVTFEGGTTERASVVGVDSVTGIAVLRVAGSGQIQYPLFGSAADLEVADEVLVVGARGSVSAVAPGTLSGLDEQMQTAGGYTLDGMLAIADVTVPESADGGALVDAGGVVVGIATDLTSVEPNQQAMAFAVPIDTAEAVANQMLGGHSPIHAWLGVEDATDVSTITASADHIKGGAEVGAVDAGSPAARAGIIPGDIVTAFDGHPVTSSGVLVSLLAQCRPDYRTSVSYLIAGGGIHKATLVVGTLQDSWGG